MRKVCLTCKKEYADDRAACPDDGGELIPLMTDPLIGTVIADKYELLSVLGVGGMSTIYKAKHKYMGRIAAIKLLHPYLIADASMFQRFQYEAKAASNLNHPNVVGVADFGITEDGKAYLVMDYLEGEDLSTILERETLLPEIQAREIFRQACAGLDHAHSKGVIHRDLKPSNLFLCPNDDGSFVVKLVDFGIAKITENSGEEAQHLTRTGEVFGSPLYMSPEQCSGKPLDPRSDLYSLGCVMYEVLTGRRPLAGATAIDTMHKHLKEAPPPFKTMAPNAVVSAELEAAVLKCLAKKPGDRYDSVAAFYEDVFGEPLPRSSPTASRTNAPSVNLEVRSGNSGKSTGVQDQSRTSPSKANQNPPRVYEKWKLPAKLFFALLSLCTMGLVTWVLFIWNGPATDRGHQIDRWAYTYHLTRGENLTRERHFADAESELKLAQDVAAKFGDNYGRLMNVYRSELNLYLESNQFEKQSDLISKMTKITSLRAHHDYDLCLQEVADIDKSINDKTTHIGTRELELRMSALMNGIRDTAGRLGSVGDYDHQENLLTQTIKTYAKLVGNDEPQLAALDLDLAESHVKQDEFSEARPLLKESLEIYCRARANKRNGVGELDEAQAWLKMGQFDRDRSYFKDAETELTTAYNMLKKYGAAPAAGTTHGQGLKMLIETLNALADYSDQTGKSDQAKMYRAEAADKKKLRKKLGIGVDE